MNYINLSINSNLFIKTFINDCIANDVYPFNELDLNVDNFIFINEPSNKFIVHDYFSNIVNIRDYIINLSNISSIQPQTIDYNFNPNNLNIYVHDLNTIKNLINLLYNKINLCIYINLEFTEFLTLINKLDELNLINNNFMDNNFIHGFIYLSDNSKNINKQKLFYDTLKNFKINDNIKYSLDIILEHAIDMEGCFSPKINPQPFNNKFYHIYDLN